MLIHSLLFFLRESSLAADLTRAERCLKSLEKSNFKTVVIYNQGFWSNDELKDYLKSFSLNYTVIGSGTNVGIVNGRQACFEWIFQNLTNVPFVSELHLDMIFTHNWETPLIDYLNSKDEPVIGCGIVDKYGQMPFQTMIEPPPFDDFNKLDNYLAKLRSDSVIHGFTHPCIHKMDILKEIGGLNTTLLNGKQAFEDDSLLLGYHYYYGTKTNWKPKVNYNSVVYHEIGGQRYDLADSVMVNFEGLVRQYGAMGLKQLANIHANDWSVKFFTQQYNFILENARSLEIF